MGDDSELVEANNFDGSLHGHAFATSTNTEEGKDCTDADLETELNLLEKLKQNLDNSINKVSNKHEANDKVGEESNPNLSLKKTSYFKSNTENSEVTSPNVKETEKDSNSMPTSGSNETCIENDKATPSESESPESGASINNAEEGSKVDPIKIDDD